MEQELLERSLKNWKFSLYFLVTMGALITFSLVMYSKKINITTANLSVDLKQKEQLVSNLQHEVAKLKQEKAELVKGNFPKLNRIKWGMPTDLSGRTVENIIFTVSRKGSTRSYQFLARFHNTSTAQKKPHVAVLLFDENGIQVGESNINSETGKYNKPLLLDASEIKSLSSDIFLTRNVEPQFFFVEEG